MLSHIVFSTLLSGAVGATRDNISSSSQLIIDSNYRVKNARGLLWGCFSMFSPFFRLHFGKVWVMN
jgi:hypothetical protein